MVKSLLQLIELNYCADWSETPFPLLHLYVSTEKVCFQKKNNFCIMLNLTETPIYIQEELSI